MPGYMEYKRALRRRSHVQARHSVGGAGGGGHVMQALQKQLVELQKQLVELQKEREARIEQYWDTESGVKLLEKKIHEVRKEIMEKRKSLEEQGQGRLF